MRNLIRSLIVLISFVILVRCGNENEALHFTRNTIPRLTFDKIMMKNLEYPQLWLPTATACPAKFEQEDVFNRRHSFGGNSLFVRNTYEGDITSRNVDYYICENPYKLSVIYHNKDIDFQFGFEVYYDKSEYKDKGFVESNREDFDSITNSNIYKNYIKQFYTYLPSVPLLSNIPSIPMVSKFLRGPLYLDDERKKEMGFLWVRSFWMKFDFGAKRVAQATYKLSVTTRGLHKCDDYDLGKEFFGGVEMKDLYNDANQKIMLTGVKVPTPNSESEARYNDLACESENQCFVKWSAVPAELFHNLAVKPTSCSDLLTVAVWKRVIYDHLNRLDNFLFALSMVIGNPVGEITVHSGVHGVLQLPTTNSYVWSKKSITLTSKGIPVPEIIYKHIKYKTKGCREPQNTSNRSDELKNSEIESSESDEKDDQSKDPKTEPQDKSDEVKNSPNKPEKNDGKTDEFQKPECNWATSDIVVIIHNNPYMEESEQICKDVCERSGWNMIKYRNITNDSAISSHYIYCCHANDLTVRKKLGIKFEHSIEQGAQYSSDIFSLNAVPMYNYNTNIFESYDAHTLVLKAYENLFEGVEYKPGEEKWSMFMENYHFNMAYFQMEEPKRGSEYVDKFEVEMEDPEEDERSAKNENLEGEK